MGRALADLMRVEISDDRMSASIVVEAGGTPEPLDAPYAESLLSNRDIPPTRERSAIIRHLLERYALSPNETHRVQIASGISPVEGANARLEIEPGLDLKNRDETAVIANADGEEQGRVDHHGRSRLRGVVVGQVIGRVHPSRPGTDGMDVFGHVVRAKTPRSLPIVVEESVAVAPDGTLTARVAGVVELNERRLRISDTLVVQSDVDFSVGNIEFPGHIVVHRGMRDEFVLRGGGDVRIADLVEAADVQAGRDVVLETGMSARGKGQLRAGRDLRAKYLADAKVVVARDIHVTKDISNCDLRIGRHLRGKACTVMRGEAWVGLTCEIAHLGTDAHVATTIVLGKFEVLEEAARQALKLAPDVLAQHERSANALSTLQRATGRLTARQAEELTELQFQCTRDEGTLRQLERGVRTIAYQMAKFAKAELVVHGIIYPGVRVFLGGYCVEFYQPLRGPLRVALDEHGGPFAVDMSIEERHPLAKFARVRADQRFLDIEYEARNLGLSLHGHHPREGPHSSRTKAA